LNAARNKELSTHGQGKALTKTGHPRTLSDSVLARTKVLSINLSFRILKLIYHRLWIKASWQKK
jgi:hypothetical protein